MCKGGHRHKNLCTINYACHNFFFFSYEDCDVIIFFQQANKFFKGIEKKQHRSLIGKTKKIMTGITYGA